MEDVGLMVVYFNLFLLASIMYFQLWYRVYIVEIVIPSDFDWEFTIS